MTPPAATSALLRHLRPEREQRKHHARAKLVERYEAVQQLVQQGLSHRAISRRLQMHRESVIRYAKAEAFPERAEQPTRPGILAPYETSLRTRSRRRGAQCRRLVPGRNRSRIDRLTHDD